MCLAVPAEIKELSGHEALVDYGGGVQRKANVSFLEGLNIGDYVSVHVGFAIQKLDRKETKLAKLMERKEAIEAQLAKLAE